MTALKRLMLLRLWERRGCTVTVLVEWLDVKVQGHLPPNAPVSYHPYRFVGADCDKVLCRFNLIVLQINSTLPPLPALPFPSPLYGRPNIPPAIIRCYFVRIKIKITTHDANTLLRENDHHRHSLYAVVYAS